MPFGPLQHKMTYNLECSLEELYHGTQKEFHIPHLSKKDKGEVINKSTKYVINVKRGSRHGDNIVVKEGGNYIPQLDVTEDLAIQIVEVEHQKKHLLLLGKIKNYIIYLQKVEKEIKII